MANPVYITYSTAGPQVPIVLDHFMAPFQVTIGVYIPPGSSATFALQFTLDDLEPGRTDPATGVVWFDDIKMPTGSTTTNATSYTSPIRAVRLNPASLVGQISLKILQGMSVN